MWPGYNDTSVPDRLRLVLAGVAILPAAFGRDGKRHEAAVVASGAALGVVAEEAGDHYAITIHMRFSFCPVSLPAPRSKRVRSQESRSACWGNRPESGEQS